MVSKKVKIEFFDQEDDSFNCLHKSSRYLKLDYVNWEVNTLFIGTFSPGCCANNYAEWFYGRTSRNMFWDTLGFYYENNPMLGKNGNTAEWMAFCKRNKLAVTDLIRAINGINPEDQSIADSLCKNFSDYKLEPFIQNGMAESNQVEQLILNSPKLQKLRCVYLTRATSQSPWNILWNPVANACAQRGINATGLLTPGGYNRYQFRSDKFPRTPENLAELWIQRYGFRDCRKEN